MLLKEINIDSFRNFNKINFKAIEGFNFLLGKNAQGKSNFLEALYSLSLGRIVRTNKEEDAINFDSSFARVEGTFKDRESGGDFSIEVIWKKTKGESLKKIIKYNYNVLNRLADLIDKAPMVLMTADDIELIKGVPEKRRRFLDLLCSRLYPPYVILLREYRKFLEARNRWLKLPLTQKDSCLGQIYSEKLAQKGSEIIYHRIITLNTIKLIMKELYKKIFGLPMPEISYHSTIKNISEPKLENILKCYKLNQIKIEKTELDMGFTMIGPNRDDLNIKTDGKTMKNFASMGEIRTIAVVLKLAEMEAITGRTGLNPIICADDCLNEFDPERTVFLIDYIALKGQVFYATTKITPLYKSITPIKGFNVSEGIITPCTLFH